MRPAARRLERGSVGFAQPQRGAIVDRRTPERLLAFATPLELLRRLIGRIEPALRLELSGRSVIGGHALGLTADEVMCNAEPGQIFLDRRRVFGLRTLAIGVVET